MESRNTEKINDNIENKASFNQAHFQQLRLHELFLIIDRASINYLNYAEEFECYNYEIVFNNLCSILSTISVKLNDTEKKDVDNIEESISKLLEENPIYFSYNHKPKISLPSKKTIIFNKESWFKLRKLLTNYRRKIEKLMDSHGYGNPTKADPSKAVISN